MDSLSLQSIKIVADSLTIIELKTLNQFVCHLIKDKNEKAFKYRLWAYLKREFSQYDVNVTCFNTNHAIISFTLDSKIAKFEISSKQKPYQYDTGVENWQLKQKGNYTKLEDCLINAGNLLHICNMDDALKYIN